MTLLPLSQFPAIESYLREKRHLDTAFGWQLKHAEADGLSPEAEKQLPINRE